MAGGRRPALGAVGSSSGWHTALRGLGRQVEPHERAGYVLCIEWGKREEDDKRREKSEKRGEGRGRDAVHSSRELRGKNDQQVSYWQTRRQEHTALENNGGRQPWQTTAEDTESSLRPGSAAPLSHQPAPLLSHRTTVTATAAPPTCRREFDKSQWAVCHVHHTHRADHSRDRLNSIQGPAFPPLLLLLPFSWRQRFPK